MTSLLPTIILGIIGLFLAIALIVPAVIAHRGKSFWGTWMMLLGAIGLTVGMIATATASFFIFQNVATSMSASTGAVPSTNNLGAFSLISGIGTLFSATGLLLYFIGLFGLAFRYGAVAKRIDDLETINASLISQNEQSPS